MEDKSDVPIAYKEYSPQEPTDSKNVPLILLHCAILAKEAWDNCAQEMADRTDTKVYCLDARNHGDSGWAGVFASDIMAEDVVRFMDSHAIPKVTIVGHCMGGKTGMTFAFKYPARLESLIIEDVSINTPPDVTPLFSSYIKIEKDALMEIPTDAELTKAKKVVASYLSAKAAVLRSNMSNSCAIMSESVTKESSIAPKAWHGEDLPLQKTASGKFEWKSNIDVIGDAMNRREWGLVSPIGVYQGPVLLIYGARSHYKVLDDKEGFLRQFPKTMYQPMQVGTHMLHRKYPEVFTHFVSDFILKQRASSANDDCIKSRIQQK